MLLIVPNVVNETNRLENSADWAFSITNIFTNYAWIMFGAVGAPYTLPKFALVDIFALFIQTVFCVNLYPAVEENSVNPFPYSKKKK